MMPTTKNGREFPTRRHHRAHLNNLVLGPASLLPFKSEWRALANALPAGNILIIEGADERTHPTIAFVLAQLRSSGHGAKKITVTDRRIGPDHSK